MKQIKAVAITEKGAVKPNVRKALVEQVAKNRNIFAEALQVDDKGQFYVEVRDGEGQTFYINFEVTVSANCIANRAPKKTKAKAPKAENEPISFED